MVLLNDADAVYLGDLVADKIYLGTSLVWEPTVTGPPGIPVTDGLAVWIDASQLGLADGAPVSPWPNLVAGGAHGLVAGGAVPPKFRLNGRNGLPVVHVNALEGRFVWNGTTGVTSPYTLVFVAAKTDLRVSVARLVGATYPPQNLLVGFYSSFDQAYVGYFIGAPRPAVANEWNMYSMDNASLGGASRFWNNGVPLPGGGGGESNWGNSLVLGGYEPTAAYDAQCPDADYGELALYNRKLSDAERQQVEAYMRTKWGL